MLAPLHELSVAAAGAALRARAVSALDLTRHALARIAAFDQDVGAFSHVDSGCALASAAAADRDFDQGIVRGPLQGIPYGLKDIYAARDMPTTCNSNSMLDHVARADAGVVARLRDGGAVLLGKLVTHEFALGGPSADLPFAPARNPWRRGHFTGGSSSGSGAAVAAGFVRVAMGSDTGGSIRSPACHCGVVGLKPTFGLVGRSGVYPLSYSLDHCGPLGWSVQDVALMLDVVAGRDLHDAASVAAPGTDFGASIGQPVDGIRIAYARMFFATAPELDADVLSALDQAAARLARLGAQVEEVPLPDAGLYAACGRIIMLAEAYAIHEAALLARPGDFGRYTCQRLLGAAGLSAADLVNAQRLRRALTVDLQRTVFDRYAVMITACALTPAPPLASFPPDWPPPAHMVAARTAAFNVTGHPALALPLGLNGHGLPLGMQLVGRAFDERTLLQVGAAFEADANAGAARRHPPLAETLC